MSLEMAWPYKEQLLKLRAKTAVDPRYYWWRQAFAVWDEKDFDINTWASLQMVSLNQAGEIVGWLDAEFSRTTRTVTSLSIARYSSQSTAAWGRDVMCFLRMLFRDFGMHAVRWTVVVGNPAEHSYDRLVERLGGRIYGRSRESAVLQDGRRADHKLYEVLTAELDWDVMNRLCGDRHERSNAHRYARSQGEGRKAQRTSNPPGGSAGAGFSGQEGTEPGHRDIQPNQQRAEGGLERRGVTVW